MGGRHHASVMAAVRRTEDLLITEPGFRERYKSFIESLAKEEV